MVAQPENRGTTAAILHALLVLASRRAGDTVAFYPSDHFVSDAQSWLWNSFVMVGRMRTLLALVRLAVPDLHRSFAEVANALGTVGEATALERLYCGLPSVDFSRHVLGVRPDRLAVLPVRRVHWDDLGEPERVLATRRRARSVPMRPTVPVAIPA